ncbi:hypothetical protein CHARACLAT_002380 [Characodon lateralis]|uniref:Uncharacterized protein n=1 Tax=Characodon lateralis TaxID=208331 RepID=A0ABU7DEW5_9TELE|nr:hypothetical protein [Characodon lateralis]
MLLTQLPLILLIELTWFPCSSSLLHSIDFFLSFSAGFCSCCHPGSYVFLLFSVSLCVSTLNTISIMHVQSSCLHFGLVKRNSILRQIMQFSEKLRTSEDAGDDFYHDCLFFLFSYFCS